MAPEQGNDQIIATAFRRSLLAAGGAAALAGLVLGIRALMSDPPAPVADADVIAPRAVNRAREPRPPAVAFTDITGPAGITHTHRNGAYGDKLLPETMGGGVAFLDYNGDNALDLLFVSGRSWPWKDSGEKAASLILYQGDGRGGFRDRTRELALDVTLYGMGAAVGDYDGDGDVDIFVTALGANRLFRNEGGERFQDVTATAGVGGDEAAWSTGAAFLDFDGDRDLDLVVLNYVEWSYEIDHEVDYRLTGIGRAYGPPTNYPGTDSWLYRNEGNGTFTDVSAEYGIRVRNPATGQPLGKSLAVLPVDVNDDGWPDLVVANDTVRNFLFLNREGNGFREVGTELGIAFDNAGAATGAMGIDHARLAPFGERAIAIGNFANEMTSFYVKPAGSALFTDQAIVRGIGPASRQALTFGLFFFDFDLDGRQDLLQANGHVESEINRVQPSQHYRQPPQLFWHCGDGCARPFVPVALAQGNGLATPLVGRGAAYGDVDGDGDLDVVLTQIHGPPRLLRNDQATGHNWIRFDVLDRRGAPAYGARVTLTRNGEAQHRRVEPTRSYLSQVETTLTFGLGPAAAVHRAIIEWPDGTTLEVENPAVNRRHVIRKPGEGPGSG